MRVTLTALLSPEILLLILMVALIQRRLASNQLPVPSAIGIDSGYASSSLTDSLRVAAVEPPRKGRLRGTNKAQRTDIPELFVVLDLETTGRSPFEDEIIEIGALRVSRATNEVRTFQSLVKPEGRLPPLISELTGITRRMLDTDGALLGAVLPDFMNFIGDLPLVIYNAKFDIAFLHEAAKQHGRTISNSYTCALELAQCAWPGLPGYKLVDVYMATGEANIESLPEWNAHRALGDCWRTAHVFLNAASILDGEVSWNSPETDPRIKKSNRGATKGAHRGTTPMYEHSVSKHGEPGCALCGEVVVFTGSLSIPRGEASSLAAAAGCEVRVGVTRQTTLLVVGDQDMSLLAGKEKSCKHLAAEALMREGQPIRILNEVEFLRLIAKAKVGIPCYFFFTLPVSIRLRRSGHEGE